MDVSVEVASVVHVEPWVQTSMGKVNAVVNGRVKPRISRRSSRTMIERISLKGPTS